MFSAEGLPGELSSEMGGCTGRDPVAGSCGLRLFGETAVAGGELADTLLERSVLGGGPLNSLAGEFAFGVAGLIEQLPDGGALERGSRRSQHRLGALGCDPLPAAAAAGSPQHHRRPRGACQRYLGRRGGFAMRREIDCLPVVSSSGWLYAISHPSWDLSPERCSCSRRILAR
jgi:hypothetical protein